MAVSGSESKTFYINLADLLSNDPRIRCAYTNSLDGKDGYSALIQTNVLGIKTWREICRTQAIDRHIRARVLRNSGDYRCAAKGPLCG
jgi:hypothetical protein